MENENKPGDVVAYDNKVYLCNHESKNEMPTNSEAFIVINNLTINNILN